MSDVNDAPDPIEPPYTGQKPGDRPLPDKSNAGRDLDAEEQARKDIIRHDPNDDANKSDDGA